MIKKTDKTKMKLYMKRELKEFKDAKMKALNKYKKSL